MKNSTRVAAVFTAMLLTTGVMAKAEVDLTGNWTVTGSDQQGTEWTADLSIGQGILTNGKYPLAGQIHWKAIGGEFATPVSAWEDFRDGVYNTEAWFDAQTMTVHIQGYQIRDDTSGGRIRTAVTKATVSPDGTKMINGTGAGDGIVPGSWQAALVSEILALNIVDGVVVSNSMEFALTLSAAGKKAVTVDYEAINGTATATVDFKFTQGTLTIPAGQTNATIQVPLLKSATPESQFVMRLSNIQGAILASREAVGEIPANWIITPDINIPGTKGGCGQGVGAGSLITLYAICWLGLVGMKWRRIG